jgi:hypothetical protein
VRSSGMASINTPELALLGPAYKTPLVMRNFNPEKIFHAKLQKH